MTAASRRALFVHAHPDDECTGNAITMARLVDAGAQVTLMTCTLGEEGEILVPELAHLRDTDSLGPHRITELDQAMAELGVTDYLRLGGDGRFRDSGMATDDNGMARPADILHDNCFWRADLLEAADLLVPVIRDRRPQVLITYDQFGNYGHPDHIMAHRVATYAAALAAVPSYRPDLGAPWAVSRTLWNTMSAEMMRAGIRQLRQRGDTETFAGIDPDGPMPMGSEDADIAVRVPAGPFGARKLAALARYPSQVDMQSPFFSMFEAMMDGPAGAECYRYAGGAPVPEEADDIFAGLDLQEADRA